ncbi:MAG: ribosome small subunit-dependent GTPase A, partial [Candidatus Hydrogenedentes bacterium]|nr:ribosome small subunit-dependent GTPase A [Candidatus Hydrogenedentota bacterium]
EHDQDGNDIVRGVGERKTLLLRYSPQRRGVERQLIAANVDMLLVVAAAAHPPFRPGLIDRFLITAQLGGVTPAICVNKTDLVEEEPEQLQLYRELGIQVYTTSCVTGEGIDSLREALRNKMSVFAGHSGVGKSSLLNRLDPELRVFTREVSEATQRGKHATTAAQLYELAGNARIIDTPGIRTLGLWKVDPEELGLYFPDIAEYSVQCRFRNCTHIHEPGCAVLDAVQDKKLAQERYASYKRIRNTLEEEKK